MQHEGARHDPEPGAATALLHLGAAGPRRGRRRRRGRARQEERLPSPARAGVGRATPVARGHLLLPVLLRQLDPAALPPRLRVTDLGQATVPPRLRRPRGRHLPRRPRAPLQLLLLRGGRHRRAPAVPHSQALPQDRAHRPRDCGAPAAENDRVRRAESALPHRAAASAKDAAARAHDEVHPHHPELPEGAVQVADGRDPPLPRPELRDAYGLHVGRLPLQLRGAARGALPPPAHRQRGGRGAIHVDSTGPARRQGLRPVVLLLQPRGHGRLRRLPARRLLRARRHVDGRLRRHRPEEHSRDGVRYHHDTVRRAPAAGDRRRPGGAYRVHGACFAQLPQEDSYAAEHHGAPGLSAGPAGPHSRLLRLPLVPAGWPRRDVHPQRAARAAAQGRRAHHHWRDPREDPLLRRGPFRGARLSRVPAHAEGLPARRGGRAGGRRRRRALLRGERPALRVQPRPLGRLRAAGRGRVLRREHPVAEPAAAHRLRRRQELLRPLQPRARRHPPGRRAVPRLAAPAPGPAEGHAADQGGPQPPRRLQLRQDAPPQPLEPDTGAEVGGDGRRRWQLHDRPGREGAPAVGRSAGGHHLLQRLLRAVPDRLPRLHDQHHGARLVRRPDLPRGHVPQRAPLCVPAQGHALLVAAEDLRALPEGALREGRRRSAATRPLRARGWQRVAYRARPHAADQARAPEPPAAALAQLQPLARGLELRGRHRVLRARVPDLHDGALGRLRLPPLRRREPARRPLRRREQRRPRPEDSLRRHLPRALPLPQHLDHAAD